MFIDSITVKNHYISASFQNGRHIVKEVHFACITFLLHVPINVEVAQLEAFSTVCAIKNLVAAITGVPESYKVQDGVLNIIFILCFSHRCFTLLERLRPYLQLLLSWFLHSLVHVER